MIDFIIGFTALQICIAAYILIAVFWFCLFAYRQVIDLSRWEGWVASFLACLCWPLGVFTLFFD